MATSDIFEVNKFLTKKLNLPQKLSASDDQIRQFLAAMAQQQQAQQAAVSKPTTSGSPVQLPQPQGATI